MVLFDIDGTLLTPKSKGMSAGARSMGLAVGALTQKTVDFRQVEFAGRTDMQIARALLVAAGEADPLKSRVMALVDRYLTFLGQGVKTAPYAVLGSPREAVDRLGRDGAVVGLGTGNVRAGGTIKLANAGIGDLFDMSKGGFGEDGDTRAEVLAKGVGRCDPKGQLPVIIVGDTPHDIEAAHEIGARCIGTPYHHNDAETLEKAGADAIVSLIDESLIRVVRKLLAG